MSVVLQYRRTPLHEEESMKGCLIAFLGNYPTIFYTASSS